MQARPLKAYLERLGARLEELEPLTSTTNLWVGWRAPVRLVLGGLIVFMDGSKPRFLEYVSAEEGVLERIVYRFHYANPSRRLVFRYDNAPRHPNIPTHPHHKHPADGTVAPSTEKPLLGVLKEVKR